MVPQTMSNCQTQKIGEKKKKKDFAPVVGREDKTIESAVPFPAPEKGDNRGLSPFHPRIIIVIGECPLLSPV